MNDKDEKIEYALKSQADENLPDADKVLLKARAEMRKEKKPAVSRKLGVVFASLAACAVMVFTIAFGAIGLGALFSGKKSGASPNESGDSRPIGTYAAEELKGRRVDYTAAYEAFSEAASEQAEFPLSHIDQSANVKYYLFTKSTSGETVLLMCEARVYDSAYGYDELTLYFELSDETFEGNSKYTELSGGYYNSYELGEYVSRAYITDGYRCMFCVMNANAYRLSHYMSALFSVEEEA